MELVVCIDIGSTHTGYAYSSKKEYDERMLNIHHNEEWMSGHANLHTFKTPSIALLQQDKTLHSFGYEAERKYTQLQDVKQQDMWYYFKRFKADLKTKQFRKDTVILEEGGKSINGVSLFTIILKYLKIHCFAGLEDSARYGTSEVLAKYNIRYVITVPTKWDNASRDCIKSAAKKAGLNPHYIHTESEAAGRYCRLVPIRPTTENSFYIQKPQTQHMIVNLGGSGIDAAVQEILEDGAVKEFPKNVGNASGGTRVDADFLKFVSTLFGNEFIDLYSKKNRIDFLELQYEFEVKKRKFSLESDQGTSLELPSSLVKMYTTKYKQSLQYMIDDTDFVGKILSQDEYLILNKTVMKDIFGPAVKSIVGYLTNLSRDPETKKCDVIILVGGFSESPVVTGATRFYFPKSNIITMEDASLTVLRGGVLLGHNPEPILTVTPTFSYGIGMAVPFNGNQHPNEKLFLAKEKQYCSAVFAPLIKAGRTVSVTDFSRSIKLSLNRQLQKVVAVPVYASKDLRAKYASEESCYLLGKLKVPVGDQDKVVVRFLILGDFLIVEGLTETFRTITQESFSLVPVDKQS
ncbi:heat shock 70 kDa protein 12A-like [Ruditapes philippinarum]|uniref:heat shock 70 kDa protein 12A-like n=1 Tax=Ruditapes philippinarum TaxID=129788 RepID=UPI00295A76AD|nr:heat shock 70 kDa protein 12A-like [Ruditapes philippinarum]